MSDFDRNINDPRNPWRTWSKDCRKEISFYDRERHKFSFGITSWFFPRRAHSWNEPLYPDDHGIVTEQYHIARKCVPDIEYSSYWGQRLWFDYLGRSPRFITEYWSDPGRHWFIHTTYPEALQWFQWAGFKSVKLQVGKHPINFQVVDDRMFDKSQAMHWVEPPDPDTGFGKVSPQWGHPGAYDQDGARLDKPDWANLGSSLYLSASHRWFLQMHDFNDHRDNDTWFQLDYNEASHWFDLAGLKNTIAVPLDWLDPTQREEG